MTDQLAPMEIAKVHEVVVAGLDVAGTSEQAAHEQDTPTEAITPPLDLSALAKLSQINGTRASIIDAICRNTVGLGFSLPLGEHEEDRSNDPKEDHREQRDLRRLLDALAARDARLDHPSFSELLYAVKTDEEECGNAYIEVSRNKQTGKIDGLFYVPAARVRRLGSRDGFVLLPPDHDVGQAVHFLNFGEKVQYDGEGSPTNQLASPPRGRRSPLARRWETNELIAFRLFTSQSRDYGLPRDAAHALEYAGDKLAAESNISFFDSSGTPPTLIFLHGEGSTDEQGQHVQFHIPQRTVERVANVVKSDSGHAKRVGFIPVPNGTKISTVQLGKISERDIGFTEYRKHNRGFFLGAFRVSPIFVAELEGSGRYTAEVERALTLEQVFDPEQRRYEQRLHETLLNDLGYSHRRIMFKRLAVESDSAKRDSADRMAEVGAITNGEYREAMGWPPLPEAGENEEPAPGQVPFGWNSQLINAGRPEGAENRVPPGEDQRGLRPGIGARRRRQAAENGPASVEGAAAALSVTQRATGGAVTRRQRESASQNGGG